MVICVSSDRFRAVLAPRTLGRDKLCVFAGHGIKLSENRGLRCFLVGPRDSGVDRVFRVLSVIFVIVFNGLRGWLVSFPIG